MTSMLCTEYRGRSGKYADEFSPMTRCEVIGRCREIQEVSKRRFWQELCAGRAGGKYLRYGRKEQRL